MKNKLDRLYLIGFWFFISIVTVVSVATLLSVVYYKEVGLDTTKPVENNKILEVKVVENIKENKKENIKDTITSKSELDTTPKVKFVAKPKVIQKESYISDTIKIDTLKTYNLK